MSAGGADKVRSLSLTVTLKELDTGELMSSLSVAVHVTCVVPMANVDPEAGSQVTGTVSPPSSVAVGGVNVTAAPSWLVESTVMSAGGADKVRSLSLTVTLKELDTGELMSSLSVAVHVTCVVPMANVDPEAGSQVTGTVSPPSSVAVGGVNVTA